MVGEVRRKTGSITIAADSTGSVDVKADTGETIKVTVFAGQMSAATAGSSIYVQMAPNAILIDIADTNPRVQSCDLVSIPVLYIDDATGLRFGGINKATTAKDLFYGWWGVKIN